MTLKTKKNHKINKNVIKTRSNHNLKKTATFRKLNCSPETKGKKYTCYSEQDLTKLKNSTFELQSDDIGEFDYVLEDKTQLKFKFLLNSDSEDLKISEFLERTITQINTSRKLEDIQDFIRYKFMARESKLFRTYIIKHTPSVLMDYEFEGEDGSTFNSGFPFGADFFWF